MVKLIEEGLIKIAREKLRGNADYLDSKGFSGCLEGSLSVDPYPFRREDFGDDLLKIAVYGLLSRGNLLDLVENFIFVRREKDKLTKVMADIFTTKIKINNEEDLRNVAFIIKGKSFKSITSKDVAHQIIKACRLSVDLVVLAHVGTLADDAKIDLIEQCNLRRRMYAIININDLAKILLAYNEI